MRRFEEVTGARPIGLYTAAAGLVLTVVGAVALLLGVGSSAPTGAVSDLSLITTTASTTSTSSTGGPTIGTSSTTLPTPTAPFTKPPASVELIEGFLDAFVEAIDEGDASFLTETLHTLVPNQFGVEVCEGFIEREILALSDYRTTGSVVGPEQRTVLGTSVTEFYEVPVSFVFQGQTFESLATFAVVDGRVMWFTECR